MKEVYMTNEIKEQPRKHNKRSVEAREALKRLQTAKKFTNPDTDRAYLWLAELKLDDIMKSPLGNSLKSTRKLWLDHYPKELLDIRDELCEKYHVDRDTLMCKAINYGSALLWRQSPANSAVNSFAVLEGVVRFMTHEELTDERPSKITNEIIADINAAAQFTFPEQEVYHLRMAEPEEFFVLCYPQVLGISHNELVVISAYKAFNTIDISPRLKEHVEGEIERFRKYLMARKERIDQQQGKHLRWV